jgi:hypothetical protein
MKGNIMNVYRLFWNDYTFEDIQGDSIEEAFLNVGYEIKDIQSLNRWFLISIGVSNDS